MKKQQIEDKTDKLYPIKKAEEMSDEEFSRWWALRKAMEILDDHARRYDIDLDRINLNTQKIINEYIDPISGDVLHHIKKARVENEIYSGP